MRIFDVQALTPPGVSPESWSGVLAEVHGPGHEYVLPEDRIGWLKRLTEEEVWGEAIVVTDRASFPFWRIVRENVTVQDEADKKLGKPQRTQDLKEWAWGIAVGSVKKSDIARARKGATPARQTQTEAVIERYTLGKSNARSLYETDGTYELITPGAFSEIREKILLAIDRGVLWCWDSETDQTNEEDSDSPNPWSAKLVDLSISIAPGHAWRLPVAHEHDEDFGLPVVLSFLKECYDHTIKSGGCVVLHNCKYDYSMLANPIQQFPVDIIYEEWLPVTVDTMLAAQIACMRPAGLKPLAKSLLGVTTVDFKKLTGGRPFSQVPSGPATVYAGQDADWPLQLWPIIQARLQELQVEHIYTRTMDTVEFFMRCERRGVRPNLQKLQAHHDATLRLRQHALERLVTCLIDHGLKLQDDFNPGSSKQMTRAFFAPAPEGLGLPVLVRTKTGLPSASKQAWNKLKAEGIHHPAILWYEAWSKQEQRVTGFTQPILQRFIQSDGRVHANFKQVQAETGRTSCTDPNLQQFYPELAACFEAETDPDLGPGEIADLDYSQIELRVLAAEFNEPKMIETYNQPRYLEDPDTGETLRDERGRPRPNPEADIHNRTQREVGLPSRTKAKNYNFGKAFGAGIETLSVTSGTPKDVVALFIQRFDQAYDTYTRNLRKRQYQAEQEGLVRTWANRVRLLSPPSNAKQKAENERLVANTPVQGGALDIIMVAIENALPYIRAVEQVGIHPILMIHDALYFEREPHTPVRVWRHFLDLVEDVMAAANPWPDLLPIYTDREVGLSWGDLHVPVYDDPLEVEAAFASPQEAVT